LLHLFGIVLIVARVLHALGLSAKPGYSAGRAIGILLTFLVILTMALLLLWRFLALHALAAG
nr:MAPEG family protein [Pseudomonadota bacterium]